MCGIVGLYLKDPTLQPQLGSLLGAMLLEMSERGPDSAGFAVYRDPVDGGTVKLTLFHPDRHYPWRTLTARLGDDLDTPVDGEMRATHLVMQVAARPEQVRHWLDAHHPEVKIMGMGEVIEIYKEKGSPEQVARRFELAKIAGSHALGHTRMATESAVTTEHSHPFSTGLDLCLVHNGSLSNHNRLRRWLTKRGIRFQTDNDSEVAAGYLTHRLREGATLKEALDAALRDLDGFYTFAVGTRDGFAVLRDPIACKPAVMAETDAWVAMASEYRALDSLPGVEKARLWEPEPATVYAWGR